MIGMVNSRLVTVVGVLVAVLLTLLLGILWLVKHRDDAAGVQSEENLVAIMAAMDQYYERYDRYPPAVIRNAQGEPLYSWRVALLPFINETALYRRFDHDAPWDSPNNLTLLPSMPALYRKPLQRDVQGYTHYQVFVGPSAAFEEIGPLTKEAFPKGVDRTVFLAEAAKAVPWTQPADLPYRPDAPLPPLYRWNGEEPESFPSSLFHERLFHVAFGNGSTRWFGRPVDERQLRQMISRRP